MTAIEIWQITAAETRPLRHALLRPHQPAEKLIYPGDNHPLAFHGGAFRQGELVGIASVTPRACLIADWPEPWQLRGMATIPEVRGHGYGRALIEACLAHIAAHGGRTLWCNGRTSALPFYQGLGFQIEGEQFRVDTGPHYVLWRPVER